MQNKSTTEIGRMSTMRATRSAPAPADKFSTLFDNNWKNNKSTIRNRGEKVKTYDPTYSWDAKSDNPNSFSRLQATEMPAQPIKPITMSGPAVILLENTNGFNAINVKQPNKELSKIPLTVEQKDLQMSNDLSGKIPFVNSAKASNNVVLMEQRGTFMNNSMIEPKIVAKSVPDFMVNAGPQCDQRLLNPKQRREIMEFERQKKQADEHIRTATAARHKTKKQMSGLQFHRGVLMVDSSDNADSEIYGERAREGLANDEYKSQIHLERMSRLSNKQCAMHTNGNILLPDTVGPRVKTNKFFQSKGGDYHALSFDETHNRLFCRLQGASNGLRTQNLRDTELSGKDYNITNHTVIEHWPPRKFERQVEKFMGHPSQVSLEMRRSLQGTVRQYN